MLDGRLSSLLMVGVQCWPLSRLVLLRCGDGVVTMHHPEPEQWLPRHDELKSWVRLCPRLNSGIVFGWKTDNFLCLQLSELGLVFSHSRGIAEL